MGCEKREEKKVDKQWVMAMLNIMDIFNEGLIGFFLKHNQQACKYVQNIKMMAED